MFKNNYINHIKMFGGIKQGSGAANTDAGFGACNNSLPASTSGQTVFGKPVTSEFDEAPLGAQHTGQLLIGSGAKQRKISAISQHQQNTSIFGAAQPQNKSPSLLEQTAATFKFGSAVKAAGLGKSAVQHSTSLFGQPATSPSTNGFGTTPTTTRVFDSSTSSVFGQQEHAAASANLGTSIAEYLPTRGTDTVRKDGEAVTVKTEIHGITAMKEYEGKSLEELRLEDYLANRKGFRAGAIGVFAGFGGAAQTSTGSGPFGAAMVSNSTTTQHTFSNFSQPQLNTSIFGAVQPQANSPSLFGQPAATFEFGSAVKPAGLGCFGKTAVQHSTLFGQPATSPSTNSFGITPATTTRVFDSTTSSAFGQQEHAAATANLGTSITKYLPTFGTDTVMKDGKAVTVETEMHCITAMKEYEEKSLEELHLEDYLANRKGSQAGAIGVFTEFGGATKTPNGVGPFGNTVQPSAGKFIFGLNADQLPQQQFLFGQSSSDAKKQTFGLSQTSTGNNGFGAYGTTSANINRCNPFGTKTSTGFSAPPAFCGTSQVNRSSQNFSLNNTSVGNPNINKSSTSSFGSCGQSPAIIGFEGTTHRARKVNIYRTKSQRPKGLCCKAAATSANKATKPSGFLFGQTNVPRATNIFEIPKSPIFDHIVNEHATEISASKYQPTYGIEHQTMSLVGMKLHTITAMKAYEATSCEELRMRYYLDNRKESKTNTLFDDLNQPWYVQAAGVTTENKGGFSSTTSSFGHCTESKQFRVKQKINFIKYGKKQKQLFSLSNGDTATNLRASFDFRINANTGIKNFSLNTTNGSSNVQFIANYTKIPTSGPETFHVNKSITVPLNINNGTGKKSIMFGNTDVQSGPLFKTGSTATTTGRLFFGQSGYSVFSLNNLPTFGQICDITKLSSLTCTPQQQVSIHQLILSKVTSPYGENSIFKDLMRSKETDYAKEIVQKINLENDSFNSQSLKFSFNTSPSIIKSKPIASDLAKKSLFVGLEEFCDRVERLSLKCNNNNNTDGAAAGEQSTCSITSRNALKSFLGECGLCALRNSTIVCECSDNANFGKEIDIDCSNLYEASHLPNKEIISPVNNNKVLMGLESNRKAEVPLDQVWPCIYYISPSIRTYIHTYIRTYIQTYIHTYLAVLEKQ